MNKQEKSNLKEKMSRLVTDALNYWRKNKAKPRRRVYGTSRCCCLLTAAYFEHHPSDSKKSVRAEGCQVEQFVRDHYGFNFDEVYCITSGFDSTDGSWMVAGDKRQRDELYLMAEKLSEIIFDDETDEVKVPVDVPF